MYEYVLSSILFLDAAVDATGRKQRPMHKEQQVQRLGGKSRSKGKSGLIIAIRKRQ